MKKLKGTRLSKSDNSRGSGQPPADKTTPTDKTLEVLKSVGCGVIMPKMHCAYKPTVQR